MRLLHSSARRSLCEGEGGKGKDKQHSATHVRVNTDMLITHTTGVSDLPEMHISSQS